MALPGPVKISHTKDGRQRRPHRFHVSRPPPTGRWIRYYLIILLCVSKLTFIVHVQACREISKIPIAGADPRLPWGWGGGRASTIHIICQFFLEILFIFTQKVASASTSLTIYRYPGGANLLFGQKLPKTVQKWTGVVSKILLCRSATANDIRTSNLCSFQRNFSPYLMMITQFFDFERQNLRSLNETNCL